jgi:hypothetical protein
MFERAERRGEIPGSRRKFGGAADAGAIAHLRALLRIPVISEDKVNASVNMAWNGIAAAVRP